MELEPGVVVAQRYRIQRQLGRGGMGEVFAAENIRTGRTVAVKVLRADSKQKSSAVARFRREARAAGAINSDYVTQVLDVEEDADHGIVIVFEILEGESLIDRLKRTGPMTFDELFPIVEQVWMGLLDAHKAGVIHRDLKPSNVFLERRNDGTTRVKILDFGISKLPKEVGGDTLTEMGQSLGTFSFMPPEQIGKAKTVDHRADIYAAATLIYQALSGQLPYAAKNILQMVDLKTKSEPRALSSVLEGPVDPRLEAFLRRSLARSPDDRYQSAQEALDAWRELRGAGSRVSAAAIAHPGHAQSAPLATPVPQSGASAGTMGMPAVPGPGFAPPMTPAGQAAQQAAYAQDPSRRVTPAPQPAYGGPQYAGAAAYGQAQQAPAQQQQPNRPIATVMIADPRSGAASPMAGAQFAQAQGQQAAAQQQQQPKFGGTIAIGGGAPGRPPSGAYPAMQQGKGINVPVVSSDTTSEGGTDQAATVAMPLRQVALQAQAGSLNAMNARSSSSAIPRVHDDNPDRGGTQLMSHAMRQQQAAQQAARISGQMPAVRPDVQPPPGEADLTTVYRREKHGPPPTQTGPQLTEAPPSRSGIGMIIGVLAFALVGFAVAAAVIHYMQTGRMIWQ
ncbi:MAG: serine/threonine protein kinase [Polyangiaceae bacterium]|nr:serine/threonine protein kinase [Polyangiaceae bacterium]